jgi:hypothetical protein
MSIDQDFAEFGHLLDDPEPATNYLATLNAADFDTACKHLDGMAPLTRPDLVGFYVIEWDDLPCHKHRGQFRWGRVSAHIYGPVYLFEWMEGDEVTSEVFEPLDFSASLSADPVRFSFFRTLGACLEQFEGWETPCKICHPQQ